jgi:hypothetical protein
MEALEAREAAARGRGEEPRGQLEAAESEVSRLVITRQTVEEVLAAPSGALPPGVEPGPVAGLARAAALLVAAEAGGDATVTSPAYRRIAHQEGWERPAGAAKVGTADLARLLLRQ